MSWIWSKIWMNVGTTGHFSSQWLALLSTCSSFSYLILSTSQSHCGWRRKNSIEPKPVLMTLSPWRFTSFSLSITMPPLFISVSSKDSLLGRPIVTLGKNSLIASLFTSFEARALALSAFSLELFLYYYKYIFHLILIIMYYDYNCKDKTVVKKGSIIACLID